MLSRKEIGQRRFSSVRICAFVAAGVLAFAAVAIVAGRTWLRLFLSSKSFRASIASKVGEKLRSEAEVAPFTLSGWTICTDDFRARGTQEAFFSELQLEQVSAELNTPNFQNGVWRIAQASVHRMQIAIGGERIPLRSRSTTSPDFEPSHSNSSAGGWLPNRVEIGSATIHEAALQWDGGHLSGTGFKATSKEGGWKIAGQGGSIEHSNLPPLEISTLLLYYREPSLLVQDMELRQHGGGVARAHGEVRPGDAIDLLVQLDEVSLSPYLSGDWRARVHGKVSGEVRIQASHPFKGAPVLHGTLSISEGQLEALPILDEIATLTRTAHFRRLNLTRATGEFHRDANGLHVRNFTAESEGLIRLKGALTIERGQIDGTFQMGVKATNLQWLPGSWDQIFTVSGDGYLWTPLRITGPVDAPRDDLSPRLALAAKNAIIENAESSIRGAAETARDAVKSGLDLLLSR